MSPNECCIGETEYGDRVFSDLVVAEPEVIEWEYAVTTIWVSQAGNDQILAAWLNRWGKDGWKLIRLEEAGIQNRRAIFRRRRRVEPEQGKCCECGGRKSEGEQCSTDVSS